MSYQIETKGFRVSCDQPHEVAQLITALGGVANRQESADAKARAIIRRFTYLTFDVANRISVSDEELSQLHRMANEFLEGTKDAPPLTSAQSAAIDTGNAGAPAVVQAVNTRTIEPPPFAPASISHVRPGRRRRAEGQPSSGNRFLTEEKIRAVRLRLVEGKSFAEIARMEFETEDGTHFYPSEPSVRLWVSQYGTKFPAPPEPEPEPVKAPAPQTAPNPSPDKPAAPPASAKHRPGQGNLSNESYDSLIDNMRAGASATRLAKMKWQSVTGGEAYLNVPQVLAIAKLNQILAEA